MSRGLGWRGAGRAAIGWLIVLAAVAGLAAFAGPWGHDIASAGGKGGDRHAHDDRWRHHHHKKIDLVTVPADQVDVSFRHRDDDRHDHYDKDDHGKRHERHRPHEITYRVKATNVGGVAYEGPVILVIDHLEHRAHVHDACGHLKDGRPYICLQRSGPWDPGDTTPKAYLRIKAGHRVHFEWHVEARPVEDQGNTVPVANAGDDQTVALGATVTLDGSDSTDDDGDPLAYLWAFDMRPDGSAAELTDPTSVNPTFVVDVPGNYVIALVVNDGQDDSAPDTVAVSTLNTAPVADAGPGQTVFVTNTVILDGSNSSDVDGDDLTFDWVFVTVPDGSAAELSDPTAVDPSFVVDLPGTYEVELVVSDGLEDSAPDTVVITTLNSPPIADAGPDQTVPLGATVELDGSGSYDVDGDGLTYLWTLSTFPEGSGAFLSDPTAETPSFVADLPGTYAVQLVVNDGEADSDPDTVVIDTENSRPVAEAGPDQTAQVGEPVDLDGRQSSDPDGDVLSFAWAITVRPDGSSADLDDPASPTPSFTPDVEGDYLVQLIVSDGELDSDPDTAMVVVEAAPVESQLSIGDAQAAEGDAGTATAVFTVNLTPAAATDVTVDFATADGTATTADGDYAAVSDTLFIPAGQTSGTIVVPVNGDLTVEPDETFTVDLSNASGATIADSQGLGTILNDDAAELVIDDVTLTEGDTGTVPFTFTVTQSRPSASPVTVDWAAADGTATTADGDYAPASGTATIPAGETSTTVSVDVIGDLTVEPDETFLVNLTNASGATLADDQGVGTIANDDAAELSIDDVTGAEGDEGTTAFTFTISQSRPSASTVTVDFATADGTATTADNDYAPASGTATILAGTLSTTVTVDVIGDLTVEPDEAFTVDLSNASGATIADPQGTGTITNDDGTSLSIDDVTGPEGDTGTVPFTFTVTLTQPSATGVTVDWATADGTATTADADYAPASGTLSILAGETSGTVTVDVTGDTTAEPDETFTVDLSNPSGASIADPQGLGTITNDDNAPPVAIATGTQSVAVLTGNATLNGGSSFDPEGATVTYAWSITDAPPGSTATLTAANTAGPSLVPDLVGPYTVQLIVNDGLADSAPAQVTVTGTNTVPVANAGSPQNVSVLTAARLNGNASFDADTHVLSYTWIIISAPPGSTAALTGANSATPSLVPDLVGDYTIQLVVNDGFENSAPAEVIVTATNATPVANAGADRSVDVGTLVILNGTNSSDADGHTLTYAWLLTGRPATSAAALSGVASSTPSFIADVAGDYTVQLIVNDGFVDSAPDEVVISTNNRAPLADAGPNQTVFVGDEVALNGSGSSDPDGDGLTYAWSVVGGPGGSATISDPTAVNPTVTVSQVGTFTLQLVVSDGSLTGTDTMDITADPLPVLNITGVSLPEGDAGTTDFVFNVTLTPTISRPVTVNFTTADGSANAPSDYAATSGTLTFPAGNGAQTVTVAVNGDTTAEPDENFSVALSVPVSATLATASAFGTIQNDDTAPSITLTPPVLNLLTGESGTMTVTLGQAAGTGGQVVTLSSGDPGLAQVPPSVTVLEGDTAADFTVTAGLTPGGTTVTASAPGFSSDNASVNVTGRSMSVTLESPLVGTTRTVGGTVDLGDPAPPGGVTVNLSSGDTGIATVAPASVFFAEGETQQPFEVTGLAVGGTLITASAAGYTNASDSITVTSSLINVGPVPVLAPGQTAGVPVSLTEPAPTGGLTVSFAIADTSIATMDATVFIPAGSQLPVANPQLTGVLIGATQVTATGAGFAPDTQDVIVTIALGLSPDPRTVVEGDTQNVTLTLSAPAPPGGLVVGTSIDDTGVATVDPTITVGAGETSVPVPVTGVAEGTTTLRASAPGVTEVSSTVNVTAAPPITLNSPTVGKDLQSNASGSLGAPAPAGNLVVTITTDDASLLLLGDTSTSPGTTSVTRTVTAGGSSFSGFFVQALTDTGTATFTARAPGYAPGSGTVTFGPSGFYISSPGATFPISTLDNDRSIFITSARLAAGSLIWQTNQQLRGGLTADIAVASSDTGVGTILTSPVTFNGGDQSVSTPFHPVAEGTADISITEPGVFSTPANRNTTITATVSLPAITVANATVGLNLQQSLGVSLQNAPPGPVTVTVTVADASVAALSDDPASAGAASVTFVGVQSTNAGTFYVQGLTEGASTTITTEADGYAPDTSTVTVTPSGFYINSPGTTFTSNTLANNTTVSVTSARLAPGSLIWQTNQPVRGGLTVDVPVTSSDTGVGAITVSPLTFTGGDQSQNTAFQPVGEGTVDVSIPVPVGFSLPANRNTTVTGTITAPAINLADFTVGQDLQQGLGITLANTPLVPVDVTVTVQDASVALVSLSPTGAGAPSVTFPGVSTNNVGTVYVQGLTQDAGTSVTTTALGFAADTSEVMVTPSAFYFSSPGSPFSTNTFADPDTFNITSARLATGSLLWQANQQVRGGLTVDLTVTSSNPSVGTIVTSPVTFTGGDQTVFTQFDPVTLGTTDVSFTEPSGFSIPSNRNTTIAVTVGTPIITLGDFTVGVDLQQGLGISLQEIPPNPVDVTVTVSAPSVALVSTSPTAAGSASVTFPAVTTRNVGTVYVQALATGDTILTTGASGYSDDFSNVTVTPSGFYISTPGSINTTDTAGNTSFTVASARLNDLLNWQANQQVRGGLTVNVTAASADAAVGIVTVNPLVFTGGTASMTDAFDPQAGGTTTIDISAPAPFSTPSNRNSSIPVTVTGTPL